MEVIRSIERINLAIYFIILFIVNMISSKWLLKLTIKAAGVSETEVNKKFQNTSGMKHQQRDMYRWLYDHAENKEKFKKLYKLYGLCILPGFISFSFAFIGLFLNGIKILIITAVILTVIVTLVIIAIVLCKKNE